MKNFIKRWKEATYSQKSTILITVIIFILTIGISVDWLMTSASFNYRKNYREKNITYWDNLNKGLIQPNTNYSLKNTGITNEWRFKSDKLHFRFNKIPSTSIIDWNIIIMFLIILTNIIATGNASVTTIKNFQLPKDQRSKMPKKQLIRSWLMFISWAILLGTIIYIRKCSTDLDTYTNTKIPIPVTEVMTGFGLLLVVLGGTGIMEKVSMESKELKKSDEKPVEQIENKNSDNQ